LEESTYYHHSALHQTPSNILNQIQGSTGILLNSAKLLNWKQAFDASSLAISLVPKMIPRALENSDKQHMLSQVSGLASCAAAAALSFQQLPLEALKLLEEGRGLLAASADEMHMNI
jgi:hypothetical protein